MKNLTAELRSPPKGDEWCDIAERSSAAADLIDEMMVLLNDAALVLPDSYHEGCKQISDVGSRIRAFLVERK